MAALLGNSGQTQSMAECCQSDKSNYIIHISMDWLKFFREITGNQWTSVG
jgi:hypothetical protein